MLPKKIEVQLTSKSKVGEPKTRANDRLQNCLHVPCTVEYEKDGKIIKSCHLPVGRVLGVLDRWAIMSKTPLP